ncbi:hybrid sensor histidine kinase/response regulator [Nodosilinea nodulosa]|uniref:hybrid sensor histidine kinase/response regulator n=1 Tax=Nodosilinea nodulosa TaxID=416001 RepID=UPI0002F7AECD|nr:response regulator [Nodosilinea nodulosa]
MPLHSPVTSEIENPQPNILVVDDIPENLRLLAHLLMQQGYAVRMAPSGPLALMALQRWTPDLILLDIRMPKMSGYEVCQQLKANEQTRRIPVIFLSALAESEDRSQAFEVGAVDYMTKPLKSEEIVARVQGQLQVLALQRQLSRQRKLLVQQNQRLRKEICDRQRLELELRHQRNQLRGFPGAVSDYTARPNQSGQPLDPDRADAAKLAKSEFLRNISHELRTPLNTILGFAQVLEQDVGLNPEQKSNLARISHSGQYLQSLINNVLLLTKLEAKEIELYNVCLNLWALHQDLATRFKPQAEAKNLTFTVVATSELPRYVYADENKLRQILTGLLDHVIGLTRAGQVVLYMEAKPSTANAAIAANQWRLEFKIEAAGVVVASRRLSPQQGLLPPAFAKASAAEPETSGPAQPDMGLSLHISREYVHLMGGEIVRLCDRDRGAYWRICLPVTIDPTLQTTNPDPESQARLLQPQEGYVSPPDAVALPHLAADLAQLSSDWICQLEKAAIKGADSAVELLIGQLPEDSGALRQYLENATLNFQFDTIIGLIQAARQALSLRI